MGRWSLVVADRFGVNLGFLEPSGLALTRRWNGGGSLVCKVPVDDAHADALGVGNRVLKAYRDGVLVFHGRIFEPLTSTEEFVTITACDPWFDLAWRRVYGIDPVLGGFLPLSYTATDAGAIAWAAIASVDSVIGPGNVTGTLRVQQGTIEPSVPRDRTYEQGKRIDEIVAELAEVLDGFGFTFEPLEGVPGKWATFNVYYPAARNDQPDVKFEFGEGTLANLDGFTEEIGFPRNLVTVLGGGAPAGTPYYSRSVFWQSLRDFDVYEDVISRTDINYADTGGDNAALNQQGQGSAYGAPLATYALKPGADAPLLIRDFDVGDLVRLAIRRGRVDVAGSFRVAEATLEVSDNGREQLGSIVVSDPAINHVPRAPEQRLFSLLEGTARRLRVLERAS